MFVFQKPSRDTINVDVWQIYIGGKTPSKYQEAADGKAAKFLGVVQMKKK